MLHAQQLEFLVAVLSGTRTQLVIKQYLFDRLIPFRLFLYLLGQVRMKSIVIRIGQSLVHLLSFSIFLGLSDSFTYTRCIIHVIANICAIW